MSIYVPLSLFFFLTCERMRERERGRERASAFRVGGLGARKKNPPERVICQVMNDAVEMSVSFFRLKFASWDCRFDDVYSWRLDVCMHLRSTRAMLGIFHGQKPARRSRTVAVP